MSRVRLAIRRYEQQCDDLSLAEDSRADNPALGYLSSLVTRSDSLFGTSAAPFGSR
jgi:hypothetical protein